MIVNDFFDGRLYIGFLTRHAVFGINCEVEMWIGADEILALLKEPSPKSVVPADSLIRCRYEQDTDYVEGKSCLGCPCWVEVGRFTQERAHCAARMFLATKT